MERIPTGPRVAIRDSFYWVRTVREYVDAHRRQEAAQNSVGTILGPWTHCAGVPRWATVKK